MNLDLAVWQKHFLYVPGHPSLAGPLLSFRWIIRCQDLPRRNFRKTCEVNEIAALSFSDQFISIFPLPLIYDSRSQNGDISLDK